MDPTGLAVLGLLDYNDPNLSPAPLVYETSVGNTLQGTLIAGAGGVVALNVQTFGNSGNTNSYLVVGKGVGKDVGVSYEGNIAFYTKDDGRGEQNWPGLFKTPNGGFGILSFSVFWGGGWLGAGFGLQDLGVDASFTEETYTPLFCE